VLDPDWPAPEAFAGFAAHQRLDLRFHDVVDMLPGLRAPARADIERLLQFGSALAAYPAAHLLVHCQMGLSRSTAALALLLAQAQPDRAAAEIIAEIVRQRPRAWPNLRVIEFGDALLGRGGALIAAVGACYRARIEGRPQLADAMIEMGRARELDCALKA
jgi:predicted protein tyrosine phosphatase